VEAVAKTSEFTEEQITFAPRQAEAGLPAEDLCRKLGVSQATFLRWKATYGQMGTAEMRRLRQLEEENKKLKQLVADLSLDKKMPQDVLGKKP
jgi:putative transposase